MSEITNGTYHIAIMRTDAIESHTEVNGIMMIRWLIVNESPIRPSKRHEYIEIIREFLSEMDPEQQQV